MLAIRCLVAIALAVAACEPPAPPRAVARASAPRARAPGNAREKPARLDAGPIPIAADDPRWGNVGAPVTAVALCRPGRECEIAETAIDSAKLRFGPSVLSVVMKHRAAFGSASPNANDQLAAELSLDDGPGIFVNGYPLEGAVSAEELTRVIERQQALGDTVRCPPPRLRYACLADRFFRYAVPVADSPVRDREAEAPASDHDKLMGRAPLTIVLFGDLELDATRDLYRELMRLTAPGLWGELHFHDATLVFKHTPQRARSEAASHLALEVLQQRGPAAYWRAMDALTHRDARFELDFLAQRAREAGADPDRAVKAVASRAHLARIDADRELAFRLGVDSTPAVFVNGRRMAIASRGELGIGLLREQERGFELVQAGTPPGRVYHELQRHAADRKGQLFDRRRVAPPPVGAPVRAKGGKVVAQLFLDPSEQACQRLLDSMQAIAQQVSGQVSFAWRFAPSDDGSEELAGWAILQAEAHRQRGDDALWAIHDTLCRHRLALAHDDLLGYARAARLDVAELEKALVDHRFDALFERDARTKTDAGIDPRAALVVGDYVVDASKPTWAAVLAARMAIENANRP